MGMEEFQEIFGDYQPEVVSERVADFQKKFFCKHESLNSQKKGYVCQDCGVFFSSLDELVSDCEHSNKFTDINGLLVCLDCGTEFDDCNYEPEWRCYESQRPHIRCTIPRKNNDLSKFFETNEIHISEHTRRLVEEKYAIVRGNGIHRGHGRKAIVAACMFHVYREQGREKEAEYFRNMFDIEGKKFSAGLDNYYNAFPEDRTKYVSYEYLLSWKMKVCGVNKEHTREIVALLHLFRKSSSKLCQTSLPQTIVTAVIYFFICLHPDIRDELGMTKAEFIKRANLTDNTITKITRELSKITRQIVKET